MGLLFAFKSANTVVFHLGSMIELKKISFKNEIVLFFVCVCVCFVLVNFALCCYN